MARLTGPGEVMRQRAFTLIELLVVMAIIATLLTVAIPRYFHSVDRAKEAALKQTLAVTRDAIDKFYGDNGRYPRDLQELVGKRYLRSLPIDPLTESDSTWAVISTPDIVGAADLYDIRSGAQGAAKDGKSYADF
jgi:general secretion pathway protein G